jgi:Bacterial regulatory helix-turn-helix protein, lysR family
MTSLRALECLVTVVGQGSLTKAAAALHMSQPALSHQIAAIERELGTAFGRRPVTGKLRHDPAIPRHMRCDVHLASAAAGRPALQPRPEP